MSFRRERYVPRGGPDGGDGGRGGDVILRATHRRNTLVELRGRAVWQAKGGQPGSARRRTGASADPVIIEVPVGTRVFEAGGSQVLADLLEDGAEWVAAAGGHGGLGNWHFKSSTNRAPRRTTSGGPGEELRLRLELMLLADIGLLGFPNAGKSTLLARLSAARPRIADYPFTTLAPGLGVVEMGVDGSFVIADIPGLVQGAADGIGLGHRFLRHLGRTRLLLHLVSVAEHDEVEVGLDPLARYRAVREELAAYDEQVPGLELQQRPELLVLSKVDAVSEERLAEVRAAIAASAGEGRTVLELSSVSGTGMAALRAAAWAAVVAVRAASDETQGDERADW